MCHKGLRVKTRGHNSELLLQILQQKTQQNNTKKKQTNKQKHQKLNTKFPSNTVKDACKAT